MGHEKLQISTDTNSFELANSRYWNQHLINWQAKNTNDKNIKRENWENYYLLSTIKPNYFNAIDSSNGPLNEYEIGIDCDQKWIK